MTGYGYQYAEKRDFIRMNVEAQISYTVEGEEGKQFIGQSQDLSANGLSMKTEHKLKTDDNLKITLTPSHDKLSPFVTSGVVLRVISNDDNSFTTSIQFTND